MSNKIPSKKSDLELFNAIDLALTTKNYRFKRHARDRQFEREISDLTVLYILRNTNGSKRKRNKKKDTFNERYADWNYCLEGLSIDKEKVRIIISFNSALMLVITVMYYK